MAPDGKTYPNQGAAVVAGAIPGTPVSHVGLPGSASSSNTNSSSNSTTNTNGTPATQPDTRDVNGLLVNPPGAAFDRNTGKPISPPPTTYNSPLPRVSSTNTTPSNPASDFLSGNNFTPPPTEDENYAKLLERSSGLINSINQGYEDKLKTASAASAARINAGGLSGSTAGGAITAEAQQPILDERNKALGEVYSNIETNAENLTIAQHAEAQSEAKNAVDYQRQVKADSLADATKSIAAMAANHLDWNKYKTDNPENYAKLVEQVGGDPNVADALFAMSVPAPEIVSTWNTSDGKGGTDVWQQRTDPITKTPSIVKYNIPGVPLPNNWTSDKLGTNSQIFKAPNFNPSDPSTYMIVSTDPLNNGAITITKDGKTTVNGVPQNDTPGIGGSGVLPAGPQVASIVGLQDPSTPLSAVIADPAIGLEGVVAGIIKNEGGSPKGVINNPGNIKFVGQAGATDSGIKASDGGTFASYATPDAGKKAIGDLVTKGAAGDKSFEDFINGYTGTTPTENTGSGGSILSAAGISLPAFNYLTQGTASMSRMSAAQRNKIMNEATQFLNSKGIDVSTFQSQYKTYNDVLSSNIQRQQKTKIMESELLGTIDNLKTVVKDKELGDLNLKNLSDIFAGKQTNDPLANQYAFHFQQLKNELAGYFAASQGKPNPDVIDNQDAADAIVNGISTGGLNGLKTSVENSTSKMKTVLDASVNNAKKDVWSLFGVGDKFQNKDAPTAQEEVKSAPEGTTGTLDNGTPVTKYGDKWYDSNGKTYDDEGKPLAMVGPTDKTMKFLLDNNIDIKTLEDHHVSALNHNFG